MMRDGVCQFVESESRQIEQAIAAVHEQPGMDLLLNAGDEVGGAFDIERHDDDAARQASEEGRDPLGAVLAPEQDALAFVNAATVKLARELKRCIAQSLVRPALDAQTAPMREGGFVAARCGLIKKADEIYSHGLLWRKRST